MTLTCRDQTCHKFGNRLEIFKLIPDLQMEPSDEVTMEGGTLYMITLDLYKVEVAQDFLRQIRDDTMYMNPPDGLRGDRPASKEWFHKEKCRMERIQAGEDPDEVGREMYPVEMEVVEQTLGGLPQLPEDLPDIKPDLEALEEAGAKKDKKGKKKKSHTRKRKREYQEETAQTPAPTPEPETVEAAPRAATPRPVPHPNSSKEPPKKMTLTIQSKDAQPTPGPSRGSTRPGLSSPGGGAPASPVSCPPNPGREVVLVGENPKRNLGGPGRAPLPSADPYYAREVDNLMQVRKTMVWEWKTVDQLSIKEALLRLDHRYGDLRTTMRTPKDKERVVYFRKGMDWDQVQRRLMRSGFFSSIYGEGLCSIDVEGGGRDDLRHVGCRPKHQKWSAHLLQIAAPSGTVFLCLMEADCRKDEHHKEEECHNFIECNGVKPPEEILAILNDTEVFKVQSKIKGINSNDAGDVEKLRCAGITVSGWVELQNLVMMFSPQHDKSMSSVKCGGNFILEEIGELETARLVGGRWDKGNMTLRRHIDKWSEKLLTYNTSDVLGPLAYIFKKVSEVALVARYTTSCNVLPLVHEALQIVQYTVSWRAKYGDNAGLVRRFADWKADTSKLPWLPVLPEHHRNPMQYGQEKILSLSEMAQRRNYVGYRCQYRLEDLPDGLPAPPQRNRVDPHGVANARWMTPPKMPSIATLRMEESQKDMPRLFGLCTNCGTIAHSSAECVMIGHYCEYPLCSMPEGHDILVCPTMHARCFGCRMRGHRKMDHATYTLGTLEAIFTLYQSCGFYTSWPLVNAPEHPNLPTESNMKWGFGCQSGRSMSAYKNDFTSIVGDRG